MIDIFLEPAAGNYMQQQIGDEIGRHSQNVIQDYLLFGSGEERVKYKLFP